MDADFLALSLSYRGGFIKSVALISYTADLSCQTSIILKHVNIY